MKLPELTKIYVIGAGGHGIVVIDTLFKMGIKPCGIFDDNRKLWNKRILNVKVLGGIELAKSTDGKFVVAIGDNKIRKDIVNFLNFLDERFVSVIHPSSVIGRDVEIGVGSMIIGGAVINSKTKIGNHVIINTCVSIDHHNNIGDFVHVAPGSHTGGNVTVGEGTLIGIGTSVIPGVKIGKWSIIGAGSVITKDVSNYVTVVGVPGKIIKRGLQK